MLSWRLRARVLAGFALVMSLMLVASVVGVMRVNQLNARIEQLVETDMHTLELARQWAGLTESNIQRRIVTLAIDDAEFVKAFTSKAKETSARVDKIQTELDKLSKTPASERLSDKIGGTRKQYQTIRDELSKLKKDGQDIRSRVIAELIPAMESYLDAINAYADHTRERLNEAKNDAEAQAESASNLVLLLLVLAIGLGVVIALAITRSVIKPIEQAQALSHSIADGDLTMNVQSQGSDELADLTQSLQQMQQQLSNTISGVRSAAEQVRIASAEIATGNMDLSNRTEQAASSLEQTGAAMQQLGEGVRSNADAARQADGLAQSASAVADRGGAMVSRVVATMQEIQQSSNKISDIIGVIDSIAFQTNILALNAAVEAARAGEQGRGFAVVASEVRLLAQRSAQAAREIKALISTSVEKVESGAKLVQDTGDTIGEVVQSVQRVTQIVAEISGSTSAQALTLGEIGQAVGALDKMTQQNAALVEESAAAAQSLRDQASQLVDSVAAFKLRA
ncbi:methyl-accepting chemotaxis protein [Roseateles oligotrophus]|uniref:Methyl-accepting chemotaxis protein n=1 Tax=Roseateles oligotrophus TaxID=1769250 RepID=A0ABT2YJD5_9BURK|nr:methyl-accepting chemotaxis protein [Roseateles oligotrophus]MCV2370138.1 methyl-accepting chemotaxis protein [Roseateles oligotrophus]